MPNLLQPLHRGPRPPRAARAALRPHAVLGLRGAEQGPFVSAVSASLWRQRQQSASQLYSAAPLDEQRGQVIHFNSQDLSILIDSKHNF